MEYLKDLIKMLGSIILEFFFSFKRLLALLFLTYIAYVLAVVYIHRAEYSKSVTTQVHTEAKVF